MPRRISWKKGMRLSDEILLAADNCTAEALNHSLMLASAGRFGLLPSVHPFQLSINMGSDHVEVASLQMTAVTYTGDVIDLSLDVDHIQTLQPRVDFPEGENELYLTINVEPDEWVDTPDGMMEPKYYFALITPQTALSGHAIPLAHIIYTENGWQEDNVNFLPPCIYVSAHPRMYELCVQLVDILKNIQEKTKTQAQSAVKTAISVYWPIVMQSLIHANTEQDTMTPAMLLADIQKVVGGFALACEIDGILHLEDAPAFYAFSQASFNFQKGYLRIKQGLGMCYAINEKIDKFSLLDKPAPTPPPAPAPEPKPDPRRNWLGKQI